MAIELYNHNKETYQKIIELFKDGNRVGIVQPTGTGKSFLYLKWIEDHPLDSFAILSPSTEIFTQLQEYAEASGVPELLNNTQMISYQALLYMTQEEIQTIHPDKIVLDEFHRTGADLWGPALQQLLDVNPNTKVLGATATPVRYLDNSKDMASQLFGRNLAVEMTLGEAVQRKILPTPQYIPVWYDITGKIKNYEGDIALISNPMKRQELEEMLQQLRRCLEASYGAEDIFKKHIPHDHCKFIVFCSSQEHLKEMLKTMPKWLSGINSNIHSYVSIAAKEDKDRQLEAFKADQSEGALKLLFTIDRLNEGLHVKGIDGVIMLRPTISPIIYLQQMGRALAVGNKHPLIFDMVNNYNSVRIPMPNGESINVFEKEFYDAAKINKVDFYFRVYEDMKEFTALFNLMEDILYVDYNNRWNECFNLLVKFLSEHHRFPQRGEQYEGVKLGTWCDRQKQRAKNPDYPQDRYDKLNELGLFDSTLDGQWHRNYALLERFVSEHHRFPKQKEQYEGVNLGYWCATQKQSAKNPDYPQDRFEKLKQLGFFSNINK